MTIRPAAPPHKVYTERVIRWFEDPPKKAKPKPRAGSTGHVPRFDRLA